MDLLDEVLQREGGYVNHRADKGGPTNYGVTLATLSSYRHKPCTAEDVKALTKEEARAIYLELYFSPFFFLQPYDKNVFELLADSAINHGLGNAIKFLQRAIGVKDDGALGPKTKQAYFNFSGDLFSFVMAERLVFYGKIVEARPDQSVFIEGWMARCGKLLKERS